MRRYLTARHSRHSSALHQAASKAVTSRQKRRLSVGLQQLPSKRGGPAPKATTNQAHGNGHASSTSFQRRPTVLGVGRSLLSTKANSPLDRFIRAISFSHSNTQKNSLLGSCQFVRRHITHGHHAKTGFARFSVSFFRKKTTFRTSSTTFFSSPAHLFFASSRRRCKEKECRLFRKHPFRRTFNTLWHDC